MTEVEAVAGAKQRHELRTLQRNEYNLTVMWWWRCWCGRVGGTFPTEGQAKAAHGRHKDLAKALHQLNTEGHT